MSEHYADCSKCAAENVSPSWAKNTCGRASCPFKMPMTAPDQPKAPPKQRVSGLYLSRSVEEAEAFEKDGFSITGEMMFALDLRDAQSALAARDARIAELETDLRLLRDAVARVASWDWTEKCCDEAAYAYHSMVKLAGCHEREDELIGFEEELAAANARADRLEAQLQAARAAGRDAGLREAAEVADGRSAWAERHEREVADPAPFTHYVSACDDVAALIRARLTVPAEPAADTGEKG